MLRVRVERRGGTDSDTIRRAPTSRGGHSTEGHWPPSRFKVTGSREPPRAAGLDGRRARVEADDARSRVGRHFLQGECALAWIGADRRSFDLESGGVDRSRSKVDRRGVTGWYFASRAVALQGSLRVGWSLRAWTASAPAARRGRLGVRAGGRVLDGRTRMCSVHAGHRDTTGSPRSDATAV